MIFNKLNMTTKSDIYKRLNFFKLLFYYYCSTKFNLNLNIFIMIFQRSRKYEKIFLLSLKFSFKYLLQSADYLFIKNILKFKFDFISLFKEELQLIYKNYKNISKIKSVYSLYSEPNKFYEK